ncbi:MAG: TIGR03915 family putative DNA repair protein [Oscillospiraceae bacterium]|nr:TIGR03915 family putative DNA repair protein [Oscillospiraceae bacterium]
MSDRGILIFAYDGSFEGFLSAVFDSFSMKVIPSDVVVFDDMEPSLLKIHYVETDFEHAKRVLSGIETKLGKTVLNMVKTAFLFDEPGKEAAILRFIHKAFAEGKSTGNKIGDEAVNRVYKMCVAVNNEAERFRQFTRFSDSNGALVSVIHPKHFVLPLIKYFFCNRIKNEHFMIFDAEHGAALIHTPARTAIIPVENLEIPDSSEDNFYSGLWKSYYRHIAIASRYNPTCRRNHMPKRFWQYLPEVSEELEHGFVPKLSFGTSAEIAAALKAETKLLSKGE